VVVLNPARVRERYKCKSCQHHICDDCAAATVTGAACKTWNQVIEELQERDARQSQSGLIILP
jgi:hypothetical protein